MGKVKEHYFEEINSRETVEDYDYQYQEWLNQNEDKEKALQIYQRAFKNVHLYDGDNSNFR
jgi:hypothetical protein